VIIDQPISCINMIGYNNQGFKIMEEETAREKTDHLPRLRKL